METIGGRIGGRREYETYEVETITDSKRRELLLCADQAEAHGHIERARWYRILAERRYKVGPKPDVCDKHIYGGPES